MKPTGYKRGSEARAAVGARKRRVLLEGEIEASKGLDKASDKVIAARAKLLLQDLKLTPNSIRLDQARHYFELRKQIATTALTRDKQLLAALGTLSKQAQHILDGLKQEAKEQKDPLTPPATPPAPNGHAKPEPKPAAVPAPSGVDEW